MSHGDMETTIRVLQLVSQWRFRLKEQPGLSHIMGSKQEGVFVLKEKGFRMLLLKSSRSGFLLGEMIKQSDKPLP